MVAYKIIVFLVNFNIFKIFWNTAIHVHFGVSLANQHSNVIHSILGFTLVFVFYILTLLRVILSNII